MVPVNDVGSGMGIQSLGVDSGGGRNVGRHWRDNFVPNFIDRMRIISFTAVVCPGTSHDVTVPFTRLPPGGIMPQTRCLRPCCPLDGCHCVFMSVGMSFFVYLIHRRVLF